MPRRTFHEADPALVSQALYHLRQARALLLAAGALKSVTRVRFALKSAEGAYRHVGLKTREANRDETTTSTIETP
jgi:hypothetical protein